MDRNFAILRHGERRRDVRIKTNIMKTLITLMFGLIVFFARDKYDEIIKSHELASLDHTNLLVLTEHVSNLDNKTDEILGKLDNISAKLERK